MEIPLSTIIFITHTAWREAPRIRHQLARLLAADGHQIVFFERATYPWISQGDRLSQPEPGITVVKSRNLIHHQIRIVPQLDWLNASVVKADCAKWIQYLGLDPHAIVFNFAHDYTFLRQIFPKSNRIVTIIHDDWEAQARLPWFGHVRRNMQITCQMSDEVFGVSTPLVSRLKEWCSPKLLLPWSVRKYQAPHTEVKLRDTLLFWGFIGLGLDTEFIRLISNSLMKSRPGWRIFLVGPSQTESLRMGVVKILRGLDNVSILPECDLDNLPLERVITALIPYGKMQYQAAIELPNKALHFLSRGIPILASGMPNLIQQPFIQQMHDCESYETGLEKCIKNFNSWQPLIKVFVEENSAQSRLSALGF